MHNEPHPQAGQTIKVMTTMHSQIDDGPHEFRVEDWWDRLLGKSWMDCDGNPAALIYALRNGMARLPFDDEVIYGKIGPFGHLVHVSEILEVANA